MKMNMCMNLIDDYIDVLCIMYYVRRGKVEPEVVVEVVAEVAE